jgi:subtilisin family serine protease
MQNTGQVFYNSISGTADDDVDAPEAWSYTTGSSKIIVAVVDTGVQTDHPDLSGKVLTGYNFITDSAGQTDDNGHGTHCAGVIGAIGNNGKGVAGVCWNVTILPCKFLDSSGNGYTSDAIEAINYAKDQGASVMSCSWGGGSYSTALKTAIEASGALVVCAAGNDGVNTDSSPQYPSSYDSSNIISVAATDWNDNLAYFSNYGSTSVDVGAPGYYIYSTYKGSTYIYDSGTSMATPMVSGIAALIKSANSSLTVSQMKNTILNTVDTRSSLTGTCVTGGRVNAYQAVKSVYTPLQAKFFGIPGTIVNPLSIQFHDASTGDPTGWLWNFGDGNSSTSQNPSHTYYTPGNFTVQLTVNNTR